MRWSSAFSCLLPLLLLAGCAAPLPRPDYLLRLPAPGNPPGPEAGSAPDRRLVRAYNAALAGSLEDVDPGATNPGALFARYDPRTGAAAWNSNWTAAFDFTGVAWNGSRAGVLVTRQHVVFAKHYPRRPGEILVFHDRAGNSVVRRVANRKLLGNGPADDLGVAVLDRPVPDSIKVYKLFPAGSFPRYTLLGTKVLLTNRDREIVLREINSILPGYPGGSPAHLVRFREAAGIPASLQPPLTRGDSGNPGFLFHRGELVLLETLVYGGFGRGVYYGDSSYQDELRAAIRELGPPPGDWEVPRRKEPESGGTVR